ncbi:DMT family transporter [Desulfoferula mesophila]|uniref:Multidrug DMT transporter permease n=1 Tax=Desulfoferula mesophila TaxID=3058419 RepID=A0AAU9EGB7_9BACT|nr:multidrug DMT transporter permease [Desulfoferula mesophilus]
MLALALLWGTNMAVVKLAAGQLPPIFQAGVRSVVAASCLWVWMVFKGVRVFPNRVVVVHGLVLGLFFGTEFGFLYPGMVLTNVARSYLLLYAAPFFVAVGAHFWLPNDRLTRLKVAGLVLAFGGLVVLFGQGLDRITPRSLLGDLFSLTAGALWGATTVYLKRFLAERAQALQTLFYQLFFSGPLLLAASFLLEDPLSASLTGFGAFSLFYQSVIVAFISYLAWFNLIHHHPASLVQAFTFFTPVAGVFISGFWILHENVEIRLLLSLALISIGLVLVNRPTHKATVA